MTRDNENEREVPDAAAVTPAAAPRRTCACIISAAGDEVLDACGCHFHWARRIAEQRVEEAAKVFASTKPIKLLLWCPECNERHIDAGEFAEKPHHTHACQHCGHVWRPAIVDTVGVKFLPGFKDAP